MVAQCCKGVAENNGAMSAVKELRLTAQAVISVSKNERILLANSEVPEFLPPTCLQSRRKNESNVQKKPRPRSIEMDSPTVSDRFLRHFLRF
jgi:hypothetical protein